MAGFGYVDGGKEPLGDSASKMRADIEAHIQWLSNNLKELDQEI
jgi:hypothetical protein